MAVAMPRPLPLTWSVNASDLELAELLEEARESFALELDIPMTVTRPPALTERDGHGDRVTEETEVVHLGYSLSPQLTTFAGSPGGYGNVFPVARALDDLSGWCSGRHITSSRGPWDDHLADAELGEELQRPLCARLAWYTVAWGTSSAWAARQEHLPFARASGLLTTALQHAFEQRREWAHADSSGVEEVLVGIRRRRRAEREDHRRAVEAARIAAASSTSCRSCGLPYDPASTTPCAAGSAELTAAYPAAVVLCAPAAS